MGREVPRVIWLGTGGASLSSRGSRHQQMPLLLKDFCDGLELTLKTKLPQKEEWFRICRNWMQKYPVVDYNRHYSKTGFANAYCFVNELGNLLPKNSVIVSGNGSACVVCANALRIKEGSRFIINSGCASMGYDLPAAKL